MLVDMRDSVAVLIKGSISTIQRIKYTDTILFRQPGGVGWVCRDIYKQQQFQVEWVAWRKLLITLW